MSEITVHPNKKLKTIIEEFNSQFPYLYLFFFDKKSWEKARKDSSTKIDPLDPELRISDIRTIKSDTDNEISIHGNTLVKNFEDSFRDTFGCYVQVCYFDSSERGFYTSEKEDLMTLTQCNEYCKNMGCLRAEDFEDNSESVPFDNSSVKTDQITLFMSKLHANLCHRIKGLEIPKFDQYAKGKSVNSTREYWADIDNEYIEGLFLEWYPEDKEFNMGFSVIAPEKNKREFKKNLAELCEKEDIITYEYACYYTYEEMEYDSFLKLDFTKCINEIAELYNKLQDICKNLQ